MPVARYLSASVCIAAGGVVEPSLAVQAYMGRPLRLLGAAQEATGCCVSTAPKGRDPVVAKALVALRTAEVGIASNTPDARMRLGA